MKTIHPAVAQHAMEESERLRGLLTQALEFTESNTCGGPDVAQLIAEMRAALSRQAEPAPAQDEREAVETVPRWKFHALVEHCKKQDQLISDLYARLNSVHLYDAKEVWFWQGDGCDHLESLACPVVIEADELRRLVNAAPIAQTEYPHEAMDKLATDRYRVGAAGAGTLHRYAVRAGDGEQELYRGSESDCQTVARKLAGAFLDGGLAFQAMIAAPVAQTAPLVVPDECPHIIVFDDADRDNEMFAGCGARPAAMRRWEQISQSWNAHLFVRIEKNSRDAPYPCATTAPQPDQSGWIGVEDRLPEVAAGDEGEFIVCVYRSHNGESYSFSARFLNDYPLHTDYEDEPAMHSGWHDVKEHADYDGWYSPLIDEKSGDKVTHWMPMPAAPAMAAQGGE